MIRTRLTGLALPIVSAPMAVAAGGELAAAVSRAGGLGLIGGGYADAGWVEAAFAAAGSARVGCGFITWRLAERPEALEVALAHAPAALFFSFGDPAPYAARIAAAGVPLICQVHSLSHARRSAEVGAVAIVAQGSEAGGHGARRGTLALVPEVADWLAAHAPEVLLLAAGGIADGRGLAAALMLGADGALVGSRLWASAEARVPAAMHAAAVVASGDDTIRTSVPDVMWGYAWPAAYSIRVLRNPVTDRWHADPEGLRAALPEAAARWAAAFDAGDPAGSNTIVGEAVGLIGAVRPGAEILEAMATDAEALLARGMEALMFRRVLIANRGEIACRVMATCRRLGVETVAVYSDADAGALHVALADTAVRIGLPPAAESYLRGERIVAAALATGAEAIHPGYGFLSENPEFAEAVAAAGLVFVGPPASAIRAMGLKDAAKALMAAAGVPVVPGWHGAEQDAPRLLAESESIGWPVLIKAVAGGGGKGMRRVERTADFAAALAAARGEARAAFGNDAVLVEKYVTRPRHVEIQVFGDAQGNAVHLFERDCSLQRRHQKVIEEAPAPGMPEAVREAMGSAAVAAAKAIGYVGAGTVEFIADGSGPLREDGFWFMEMNTRLQVEHPVTEAITGEDLVEWQLRVAAGEPLPRKQRELAIRGHAVEARLYAEDPAKGFLPAIGRLSALAFPAGVRVDAGVREGDEIPPWYDPMIAKLVAEGPTRAIALAKLGRALEATRVAGCTTNLGFLARLVRQADFAAGEVDTGLIERHLDALTAAAAPSADVLAVAALAASDLLGRSDPLTGFAIWRPLARTLRLEHAGTAQALRLETLGPGRFRVDGRAVEVDGWRGGELACRIDGVARRFGVAVAGGSVTVFDGAEALVFRLPDPLAGAGEAHAGGGEIRAPMPGLVKLLAAEPGAAVGRGEVLVVLEAMKMEHALAAPRDGVVAEVLVAVGAQVTDGSLLLTLEPEDG